MMPNNIDSVKQISTSQEKTNEMEKYQDRVQLISSNEDGSSCDNEGL